MRLKFIVLLTAAAALAGAPAMAVAKSAKAFAPGQQMQAAGAHDASSYAPGHKKKRLGLKSARSVAPGHLKR